MIVLFMSNQQFDLILYKILQPAPFTIIEIVGLQVSFLLFQTNWVKLMYHANKVGYAFIYL